MKHHVPFWTYVITPLVIVAILVTPLDAINASMPEAAPLLLVLISIGIALIIISMTHWIKALLGGDQ